MLFRRAYRVHGPRLMYYVVFWPLSLRAQKAAAVPESRGFLSDWRVQLPIGFLAAIPLLHNQVSVLLLSRGGWGYTAAFTILARRHL